MEIKFNNIEEIINFLKEIGYEVTKQYYKEGGEEKEKLDLTKKDDDVWKQIPYNPFTPYYPQYPTSPIVTMEDKKDFHSGFVINQDGTVGKK